MLILLLLYSNRFHLNNSKIRISVFWKSFSNWCSYSYFNSNPLILESQLWNCSLKYWKQQQQKRKKNRKARVELWVFQLRWIYWLRYSICVSSLLSMSYINQFTFLLFLMLLCVCYGASTNIVSQVNFQRKKNPRNEKQKYIEMLQNHIYY